MAKIKKRKLRWKASESAQVVGYKLYWAEGESVDYDSESIALGNLTEVVLPDDVPTFEPTRGPVAFGVSAVDELGNESDLTTFVAPYQFNVPQAPEALWIDSDDDSPATHEPEIREPSDQSDPEELEQDDEPNPIPLFDKRMAPSDEEGTRQQVATPPGESQTMAHQGRYESSS